MPTLRRLCNHLGGCGGDALPGRNYCGEHAALRDAARKAKRIARLRALGKEYEKKRPSACARGYNRRWQRQRKMYLRRNPFCCKCPRLAEEVDHIIPLAEGGTHDETNLQGFCKPCHSKKTISDNRGQDGRIGGRRLKRESESFDAT